VWICQDPRGHLQAVGTDAAGRRQYRYHEEWRTRRDREKFDEMLDFARALPRLRRRVAEDLAGKGFERERVLAASIKLLDVGFFRVGGETYAEENESYGLATIRKSHVRVTPAGALFQYRAKSGQEREQLITDPDVIEIVRALKRRSGGGEDLLAYREGRTWVDVQSTHINEYLKQAMGGDFSAKDFRTWNATVLAAWLLGLSSHQNGATPSKTGRKREMNTAVRQVASLLGNTPAVSRKSYIDPRVFDRFLSGWTIGGTVKKNIDEPFLLDHRLRRRIELAVVDLLEEPRRSPAVERVAPPVARAT
jgi:DNA topoisomerase I